jgi:hypothetical protein
MLDRWMSQTAEANQLARRSDAQPVVRVNTARPMLAQVLTSVGPSIQGLGGILQISQIWCRQLLASGDHPPDLASAVAGTDIPDPSHDVGVDAGAQAQAVPPASAASAAPARACPTRNNPTTSAARNPATSTAVANAATRWRQGASRIS